jgi:hypothetical protein
MTISVDCLTRTVTVPKADTTLIQASPEIRELNSNTFRLWLADWADGEDGIAMPYPFNHNTEVVIDGLAYARTIEIINGYTITFEEGVTPWAVNIVGSNNNIHSKTNVNHVSVRPNNSAGLVNVRAAEDGAFGKAVIVDLLNGTAGTAYPIGTSQSPSNNLLDAKTIASVRGFKQLTIRGGATFDTGDNLSGFVIRGENAITTQVMINTGADVTGCQLEDMFIIDSVLDGFSYLKHCYMSGISGVEGFIESSILARDIGLTGTQSTYFVDCKSACVGLGTTDLPVIDMAGSGRHLAFRNWSGPIKIKNSTDSANSICFDVVSGATITIDSTCTAGAITIRGIANIENNGTMTVSSSAQLDNTSISEAVATRAVDGSITTEQAMRVMLAALAGKRTGLGTATEQYMGRDGVTPRITLTPTDAAGNGTPVINGAA